jgi:hypothetical protein
MCHRGHDPVSIDHFREEAVRIALILFAPCHDLCCEDRVSHIGAEQRVRLGGTGRSGASPTQWNIHKVTVIEDTEPGC